MPVSSPFVVVLTAAEEAVLTARARSGRTEQFHRVRTWIVLAAAGGVSNAAIAAELRSCVDTARRWRRQFATDRMEGLTDRPVPDGDRGSSAPAMPVWCRLDEGPPRQGRRPETAMQRAGISPWPTPCTAQTCRRDPVW